MLALGLALTSASYSAATSRATAATVAGSTPEAGAQGSVHARKKTAKPKKKHHRKKKAARPCAGHAPKKPDGTRWRCSFSDEFSGKKLNRKKWRPVLTRKTGLSLGPTCYVDRPDVIRVSKGLLRLSVRKAPEPFTCKTGGKKQVDAIANGGSVSTMDTFTQTYGLYKVRAAFPGTHVPGLQSAIWLFPKKLTSALLTTDVGEIDVAEFYTFVPDRVIPALHYGQLGVVLGQHWTNNTCLVSHPQRFHTYSLEWSPKEIAIKYDGKTCLVNRGWTPMPPLLNPAPFNKPFGLILTQGLGVRGNALKRATPPPAVMKVNWVRVWR